MFGLSVVAALCFAFAGVQSLQSAPKKRHAKGALIRILAGKKHQQSKDAFIGHLTIPPHGKVPLHRDSTEEYIYILSGFGTIWIDGKAHKIKKDDLVYMPAGAEVRFENGDKELEGLQVFAPQGPEKKYESWGQKASKK